MEEGPLVSLKTLSDLTAEFFYYVKYCSSIITSENWSENLNNKNKNWCFCCLLDKTLIKMPKRTGNKDCLFSLLRFSDQFSDIIIDNQYLAL